MKRYLKDFWTLFSKSTYLGRLAVFSNYEEQHHFMYVQDGVSAADIKRKVEFCHPDISVATNYPPKGTDADVCIINLEKSFNLAQEKCSIYGNYEEFLGAVKMLIPGEFVGSGIYTNIKYPRWVAQNVLLNVMIKSEEKSLFKRIVLGL